MATKQFSPIKTTDDDLNRIQDNIREPLNTLIKNPLNSAKWMAKVSLAAGTNLVSHGLGRAYLSFWTGNHSSTATVIAGTSPDATKYLALVSSAPCVADVFVF